MIRKKIVTNITAFAAMFIIVASGCKKNNDDDVTPPTPVPDPLTVTYTLKAKDLLGVTGTVTIAEKSSGSTESVVTITLTGAPAGIHPAHIHMNSAIETGPVMYPLTDVGVTGNSTTILLVSYNTLINFDGYINVHLDALNMGTIIAQGDIGGNHIIDNKIYPLVQDSTTGVSGSAKFEKRKNGNTLVTIDLTPGVVLPPGFYPAYINLGSLSTVGTPVIRKTLNSVDYATRTSLTNIKKLDDGTAINYDNWMVYDGFITIHDATDTTNVIAKGNIGSN